MKNSTLKFLDVGHNRLRNTGIKAIIEGVRANPDSQLRELGVCSNFINDDGMTKLFEELIIPGKDHG